MESGNLGIERRENWSKERQEFWESMRNFSSGVKKSIHKSKFNCYSRLRHENNTNPWGVSCKVVTDKWRSRKYLNWCLLFPQKGGNKPQLTVQQCILLILGVIEHYLRETLWLIKDNMAPGSNWIPKKAFKLVSKTKPGWFIITCETYVMNCLSCLVE